MKCAICELRESEMIEFLSGENLCFECAEKLVCSKQEPMYEKRRIYNQLIGRMLNEKVQKITCLPRINMPGL